MGITDEVYRLRNGRRVNFFNSRRVIYRFERTAERAGKRNGSFFSVVDEIVIVGDVANKDFFVLAVLDSEAAGTNFENHV